MYNMGYVTRILLNYNNFAEKHLLTVNQWCEEKESGVDAREGALKDSLLCGFVSKRHDNTSWVDDVIFLKGSSWDDGLETIPFSQLVTIF